MQRFLWREVLHSKWWQSWEVCMWMLERQLWEFRMDWTGSQ